MITEPWFAYPPEMNAARIIGPGPVAWYVAAGIWALQAAQAAEAQAIFTAQNMVQVTHIDGRTSEAVADSIGPFSAWIASMQAAAAQAALDNKVVGDAHVAAMAGTVPLPVIIANRVAAATAHAANAVGAINPASIALEAQYAGFQVQNASTMTGYDTAVRAATVPRTFAPPPPLTPGGAGALADSKSVIDAIHQAVQSDTQAIAQQAQNVMGDPATVQQLHQQAQMATGQFAPQTMPVTSQMMTGAQYAMAPAQSLMGQMSTPRGGVMGNGLGSGSAAMSGLGGGMGAGGSGGGLPLAGFAAGGLGGVGVPALAGTGSLAPVAPGMPGGVPPRPFSGIPLGESSANAGARGPLGGVPAAGGRNAATGETKSKAQMTAEEIHYVDPVAEEAEKRRIQQLFS